MKFRILCLLLSLFTVCGSQPTYAYERGVYSSLTDVVESGRLTGDFSWQNADQIRTGMGLLTVQQLLGDGGYEFLRCLPYHTYIWNDGTHVVVIYLEYNQIVEIHTLNTTDTDSVAGSITGYFR